MERYSKQDKLFDYKYEPSKLNLTQFPILPQFKNFMKVIKYQSLFNETVDTKKRKSLYPSSKLSELILTQNILGIDRLEQVKQLEIEELIQKLYKLERYPDPETFRNELGKYTKQINDSLFELNIKIFNKLAKVLPPQYIDLIIDTKTLVVYGQQEGSKVGYNHKKHGRNCYQLKICTILPFNIVLCIELQEGNTVGLTGIKEFIKKSIKSIPKKFVINTTKLDKGFFSEDTIESIEAEYIFYEIAAKKYNNLKQVISFIKDQEYTNFNEEATIQGTTIDFRFNNWKHVKKFIIVRKLIKTSSGEQLSMFDSPFKWLYQAICYNDDTKTPKQTWQSYNKRANIELTIRELDYDFYLTKIPTSDFYANYAYFWHCILAYNLMSIFKMQILGEIWQHKTINTIRNLLVRISAIIVNRNGKFIILLPKKYKYLNLLNSLKNKILIFRQKLQPC